jgi:GlcNAc-P-P-Und epimerase
MRRVLVTGGSGFIGTNLVEALRRRGDRVLNVDVSPPADRAHKDLWCSLDIRDRAAFADLTQELAPQLVFHAAARTDLKGAALVDYRVNVEGTMNVLSAVEKTESVQRVVMLSSMLVCRLGYAPKDDDDYCPTTPYGESKAEAERCVRNNAGGLKPWIIVRPTSIWGPWFRAPYRDFFVAVARQHFRVPRDWTARRSLGFVGNAVHQLLRIGEAPASQVQGRTFYLCDYEPVAMNEWASEVAHAFAVSVPKEISTALLRAAAIAGDSLEWLGMTNPPLTTFRLNNMLTDAVFATGALKAICGSLPYTRTQGVAETVQWMKQQALV